MSNARADVWKIPSQSFDLPLDSRTSISFDVFIRATSPMRPSIQILFSAASFAAVFLIGLVFGMEFRQAGIYFEETLDGKPLPGITRVFVSNSWLASLALSLPWFVLLGFPLLAPMKTNGLRSQKSFVFRYLAFLSLELFLAFVLVMALLMPILPYYPLMDSTRQSWADFIPNGIAGGAGGLLGSVIVSAWIRRSKAAQRE